MSQEVTLRRSEASYAQTANGAMRHSVAIGGFADKARAGEDAVLCFWPGTFPAPRRAKLAARVGDSGRRAAGADPLGLGCEARFATSALVHRAVQRRGVIGTLRTATRWTASVRLFAEHPRTRTMLYRRFFWIWHYLLPRSALALLGPRWLRRLMLARRVSSPCGGEDSGR